MESLGAFLGSTRETQMLPIEEPTSKINRLESELKRAQEKILEIKQWKLDFDKKVQAETTPQEGTQHSPEDDSEIAIHPETPQTIWLQIPPRLLCQLETTKKKNLPGK